MNIAEELDGWCLVAGDGADRREDQLLHRARQGDTAAQERLLKPHLRAAWTVCLGMLGDREDASDALQETLVRAIRALPRFRGEASVRTWLIRIAVNACLSHQKSRKAARSLAEAVEPPPPEGSPERAALQRLYAQDALAQLIPRRRTIIILREVEGMSAEEVGAVMGWSEKRVRNELYHARATLRDWCEREVAAERDGENGGGS